VSGEADSRHYPTGANNEIYGAGVYFVESSERMTASRAVMFTEHLKSVAAERFLTAHLPTRESLHDRYNERAKKFISKPNE
jgi:hypothetical protein